MPGPQINLTSRTIKDTFIDGRQLRTKAIKAVNVKINKIRDSLLDDMWDLFLLHLDQNDVWRGLKGQYAGNISGRDLQAEFGLRTDPTPEISPIVYRAFDVEVSEFFGGKQSTPIGIEVVLGAYRQRIANEFQYTSDPSGEAIRWGRWIMNLDAHITDEHGIKYGSFQNSRSGRAIMVSLAQSKRGTPGKGPKQFPRGKHKGGLRANKPYSLPRILIPKIDQARDFIEDTLFHPSFRGNAKRLIEQKIKTVSGA